MKDMKKEIAAIVILVLIFVVSLINLNFLENWLDDLSGQAVEAAKYVDNGDLEKASAILNASLEDWLEKDNYVHIMLRHDEIDPITDEYFALMDELNSGGDATSASFGTLLSHLHELQDMERISLSSIF